MTELLSLEFLVAVLFIVDLFLFFLLFLIIKRVNHFTAVQTETPAISLEEDSQAHANALASASEVLSLLEPLVKESESAAREFDSLIREKKKITKDLNDALDSRIISINLLLSRAGTLQRQMEEQQSRLRRSLDHLPVQPQVKREPDVIDQQNQIIELYRNNTDVDTIAEQLSIPKGEVQLVVDLKEKFMAMERGK